MLKIGHQIGHQLEDENMLNDMQFGTRSRKRCIRAVLKKVLGHDQVGMLKQTAAYIKNDAIGCYNRLINWTVRDFYY
jgi:hypothetical protein